MKRVSASLLTLAIATATVTNANANEHTDSRLQSQDLTNVTPALAAYTENILQDDVWERDGLSARDRSIATLATLVARNDSAELPYHFNLALDNGVEPGEIAELITHLAFYSGWGNATSATELLAPVFEERGISGDQLPGDDVEPLPLDEEAEEQRATFVESEYGTTAPGVVHFTTEALFLDLWLRPGLEPRDRSLVTVSALIANGNVEQVPFHLNRAMDNGLTQEEASEVLTQLAFYAGWPNVFSAMPIVRDVFESRED